MSLQPIFGRRKGGAGSRQSMRRGSWPVLAATMIALALTGCIKPKYTPHPPAPQPVAYHYPEARR